MKNEHLIAEKLLRVNSCKRKTLLALEESEHSNNNWKCRMYRNKSEVSAESIFIGSAKNDVCSNDDGISAFCTRYKCEYFDEEFAFLTHFAAKVITLRGE